MTLLATERETYDQMWGHEEYAAFSPGEKCLEPFLEMSGITRGRVLDAGTGSGKGALALRAKGFDVVMADLTAAGLVEEARALVPVVGRPVRDRPMRFHDVCLWHDVRSAVGLVDVVYCCDVMEHIPTPFTMLVVQRLMETARRGVFFSIALVPDRFGALVGQPLHKTVQSFVEWREQLREFGRLVECRDLCRTGLYYVEGR